MISCMGVRVGGILISTERVLGRENSRLIPQLTKSQRIFILLKTNRESNNNNDTRKKNEIVSSLIVVILKICQLLLAIIKLVIDLRRNRGTKPKDRK